MQSQMGWLRRILVSLVLVGGVIAAVGAQYQYTIGRDVATAQMYAGIGVILFLATLIVSDVRRSIDHPILKVYAPVPFRWSQIRTLMAVFVIAWAYLVFRIAYADGAFSIILVVTWLIGVGLMWWLLDDRRGIRYPSFRVDNIPNNLQLIVLLPPLLLGCVFLFYRLYDAPVGMVADHLEKMFDLVRIRDGEYPLYFTLNSGREPFHFYAGYMATSAFGISFMSIKFVSACVALLTLPVLYQLGQAVDGWLTGWLALVLGAMSVWVMLSGRSGFRAGAAALGSALVLLYWWRALYTGQRRDFLLAGLWLGLAQYTYTSARILPLLVIVGLFLRLLETSRDTRKDLLLNTLALVALSTLVYMPMFAFWQRDPEMYWYRSNTMLVGTEQNAGDTLAAFVDGFFQSLTMFNITVDLVALNIINGWSVLGPVTGALWLIGLGVWGWRILKTKRPLLLLLPAALLILILPSALAFNTPREMPSARRAVAALPVVLLFAAMGLSFVVRALRRIWQGNIMRHSAILLAAILLGMHGIINWHAYFETDWPVEHRSTYTQVAVAEQIKKWGDIENAYLLFSGRDFWIDVRLVAVWLGEPLAWQNLMVVDNPHGCLLPTDGAIFFVYSFYGDDLEMWLYHCFADVQISTIYYGDGHDPLFRIATAH